MRSVFTLSNASSSTSCARPSIPGARRETANAFSRRTFVRVRLPSESANATSGGLNDVCMSHVPNIKWSAPSSAFVPTTYAPYGICCNTFFFAFLSIDPTGAGTAAVPKEPIRGPTGRAKYALATPADEIVRYFYTGIRVRDLDRSIAFYRTVMGMHVTRRGRMGHGGVWVELKSDRSHQRLELNWYPPGSKFHTAYRRGEELDHLAFHVTDVAATFKDLVAQGAHPEVKPFREDRYEFAFVSDPDGIWIELLGRRRERPR